MEKYLDRCIVSMLSVIRKEKLQVIVVNDGSKDRSSEIAHRYANQHPDIVCVIDKKNGHYGSCVNAAFPIVEGKYVRLVDADDAVNSRGVDELLTFLDKEDVDIVFTDYEEVFENNNKRKRHSINVFHNGCVINTSDSRLLALDSKYDFAMHHMTLRTELLRRIGYKHTEGVAYTDTEYVFYPLLNAKKMLFTNILVYEYTIGRAEQSVSIESRVSNSWNYEKILNRMLTTKLCTADSVEGVLQRGYLSFVVASYYHICIILDSTKSKYDRLIELDINIKAYDKNLYKLLDSYKCLGVPYVKLWRRKRLNIIPSSLYTLLKQIRLKF